MADEPRDLRKRENTRARLLEAAALVFAAKGFEGAKIDDVVKESGFTRGAFYSNYSSMDDLLREVLVERSTRMLETVETAFARLEGTPDVDAIMAVLDAFSSEGRRMYVLTSEYNLYLMRHPDRVEGDGGFPVAEKARLEGAVARIVSDVLARMGRRPLFPAGTISRILATFYLESFSPGASLKADGELLRDVVEAVILSFSEPVDEGGDDASEGEEAGRRRRLGPLGDYVRRRVHDAHCG